MKKQFIITILFAMVTVLFFSCQKNNTAGVTGASYYIKGKKNGASFTFTAGTQAMITDAGGGVKLFNMIAKPATASSEGFNLAINFFNGTAITTGTYSENYTGTNYIVGGVYNPGSTTFVYAAGIQTTVKPLVINILTKTSTEVSGTFEGAFYKQNISTGTFTSEFVTITEGEFKLEIK